MATLINGDGNLSIYAAQDADWFASIMGDVTSITEVGHQLAYSIVSSNEIAVSDGVIITKEGRRIQVDTDNSDIFEIPSGQSGAVNYYIIGYYLYRDSESNEVCDTFVELMDSATATIEEDTFKSGANDVYVSLYRVTQNYFSITNVELLLPQITNINNLVDDLTASDNLRFQFTKSGSQYGYLNSGGTFVPFKNPTGTKSITANGTYDVTDYASASVNVPNTNNQTYSVTSNGIKDLGATNSVRYLNVNVPATVAAGNVVRSTTTRTKISCGFKPTSIMLSVTSDVAWRSSRYFNNQNWVWGHSGGTSYGPYQAPLGQEDPDRQYLLYSVDNDGFTLGFDPYAGQNIYYLVCK